MLFFLGSYWLTGEGSKSLLVLIPGALVAAILVGLTDTLGGIFLPELFKLFMEPGAATSTGSAIASMAIYILMGIVLIWRPTGLYGARA